VALDAQDAASSVPLLWSSRGLGGKQLGECIVLGARHHHHRKKTDSVPNLNY